MGTGKEQSQNSARPESSPSSDDAWLARPSTIRLLWRVFSAVLALTVLAQLGIKVKGYFGVDGWFAFGAIYGFLACFAMVVFAKVLGRFLKRDVDYYRTEDHD
jgi:hypothetical protein